MSEASKYNVTGNLDMPPDWLRSLMASLLCYMAEQMPEKRETTKIDTDKIHELEHDFREWNEQARGFNSAINDCRTILIEEAKKLTGDV